MTSIIKGKSHTFTATRYSGATDGTFVGIYDESSGTVYFFYSIRMSGDTPTSAALWMIPEGYRPKSAVSYPVIVFNSGGSPVTFNGYANPNGSVTQTATSSCRQAFGVGMYKI